MISFSPFSTLSVLFFPPSYLLFELASLPLPNSSPSFFRLPHCKVCIPLSPSLEPPPPTLVLLYFPGSCGYFRMCTHPFIFLHLVRFTQSSIFQFCLYLQRS